MDGVNVLKQKMGKYDLYIFKPNKISSRGAIIFFHGGGFVCSSPATYQRFLSVLAKTLGVYVFAPNYRKAPENPWPIPEEDSQHAAEYIFKNNDKFQLDRSKIVFAGDSAGGFLTLTVWHRSVPNLQ